MAAEGRRGRGLLLPVVVALVGLVAIGVAENAPRRHGIEGNLTSRSAAALRAAGIDGRVEFTGRDGTVYLPAGADPQRALDIVLGVDGVRDARVVRPDADAPGPSVTLSISPEPTPTDTPTPAPSDPPTPTPAPSDTPGPTASTPPPPTPTPTPTDAGPSLADVQRQIDALGTV